MKRLGLVAVIVYLGVSLSGCTKCGPFWYDWAYPKAPASCRDDPAIPKSLN